MLRYLVHVVLTGFAALACLPAVTAAAPTPEVEPNDNIFQIGVQVGVDGFSGEFNTTDDVDYFRLGLRPQRQVRWKFDVVCPTGGGHDISIEGVPTGTSGITGYSLEFSGQNYSSTNWTLTTPGVVGGPTQQYLVRVSQGYEKALNCKYSVSLLAANGGPTDAIDPAAVPLVPVLQAPEPDDLESQATGPMVGETEYEGKIETSNDVDRFKFQVRAGFSANVRVAVATGSVEVEDDIPGTSWSSDIDASEEVVQSSEVQGSDNTYNVKLRGTAGSLYRLSVSPASSLGTTPAPPPEPEPPAEPTSGAARLSVLSRATRLPKRGRRIGVTVRCRNVSADRCRVTLRLKRSGRTIAVGRRVIYGDSRGTVYFTIPASIRRLAIRKRSVVLTVSGTSANNAGSVRSVSVVRVQLRRPR